jgi:hypothetical protein
MRYNRRTYNQLDWDAHHPDATTGEKMAWLIYSAATRKQRKRKNSFYHKLNRDLSYHSPTWKSIGDTLFIPACEYVANKLEKRKKKTAWQSFKDSARQQWEGFKEDLATLD